MDPKEQAARAEMAALGLPVTDEEQRPTLPQYRWFNNVTTHGNMRRVLCWRGDSSQWSLYFWDGTSNRNPAMRCATAREALEQGTVEYLDELQKGIDARLAKKITVLAMGLGGAE